MKSGIFIRCMLLLICAHQLEGFTYSCNEFKYHFSDATFTETLTYACIVTQESYANFAQLRKIYLTADKRFSFADIAQTPGNCVEKTSPSQSWKVSMDAGLNIDCTQEFTLVMTSEPANFIAPLAIASQHALQGAAVVVVPQTGVAINALECDGDGNVTVSTGAGAGMMENRYEYRSWSCASMPQWIVSFDSVLTIEADPYVTYFAEYTSDLSLDLGVHRGAQTAILTSGRSDDQQNLAGVENRVTFAIWEEKLQTVTMDMKLQFDDTDSSIVLKKSRDSNFVSYHDGKYTESFTTNYFQVLYAPRELKTTEIYYSSDFIVIEAFIGEQTPVTEPITMATKPTTVEAPKTTTVPLPRTSAKSAPTTSRPATAGPDAYCNCAVDKFGLPDGWSYNDIWLDIVIILDTSEAMGEAALVDAGALIESFISDGLEDFLITDSAASFYTRVGVIAMSDTAEVLYNLNMTKADKIGGKAMIKKGVDEIDISDAFDAALAMFNQGLKDEPDRVGTRPVIYYMTDSNPGSNLNPINQFKASQGIVIVDNFLEEGEVEIPKLADLASDGYYFVNSNYMQGLQAFCKANCFCKSTKDAYGGSDPAIAASGGCYHPSPAGVPFNKAMSACMDEAGILATIHNNEKGQFLQQLMTRASSKSDYFWMGYQKSDEGVWQWEDGSTDSYTNWEVNEPNNAAVAKCAYVDTTTGNLAWGAGNCQIGFPYVCQYAPCSAGYKDC